MKSNFQKLIVNTKGAALADKQYKGFNKSSQYMRSPNRKGKTTWQQLE